MNRLIRRIVYLLVITLVINVGGWTFNKEAVADMWFDEQQSVASDRDQSLTKSDAAKVDLAQNPCNHWCHAIGHFMGLPSHWAPTFAEFTNGQIPYTSLVIGLSSPDSRFRPPRLIS
ncbi:MAG: hypothetical protein WBZ31_13070 [Thiobacillus sp.]